VRWWAYIWASGKSCETPAPPWTWIARSITRVAMFGATILIIAILGVLIYVIFYFIGKRWASWEA
jgi:ABC-type nitrate/sulfonate/bicarbonate transport system permease component